MLLPFSPLAGRLGFEALPAAFMAVLAVMIVVYLVVIELGKRRFYRSQPTGPRSPGPANRASGAFTTAPRAGRPSGADGLVSPPAVRPSSGRSQSG